MNARSDKTVLILRYASFILAVIPFCISVLAVFFMPSEIPMHYNSSGEVDRIGDNMEFLIIGVLFSATALIMAIAFDKIKMPNNGKIIGFCGAIAMAIIFVILTSYFAGKVFSFSRTVSLSSSREWASFVISTLGAVFLVVGSVMPILLENTRYGKSVALKLFVPLTVCICSILTMILCLVVKNFYSLLILAICMTVCLAVALVLFSLVKKQSKIDNSIGF